MAGSATPTARRRRLVLGVAVALALLVVVGRLQQGGLAPHRPAPAPAPPTTTTRPLPVTATIPLGVAAAPPFADQAAQLISHARLAVGAGGVWIEGQQLSQDGAVIFRVDPASGRLRGTITTGDLNPAALAAGFGALWLLRPGAGVLLRLDPAVM
jgi:hypothetical protein